MLSPTPASSADLRNVRSVCAAMLTLAAGMMTAYTYIHPLDSHRPIGLSQRHFLRRERMVFAELLIRIFRRKLKEAGYHNFVPPEQVTYELYMLPENLSDIEDNLESLPEDKEAALDKSIFITRVDGNEAFGLLFLGGKLIHFSIRANEKFTK